MALGKLCFLLVNLLRKNVNLRGSWVLEEYWKEFFAAISSEG
jgi:hypothetical protein